jgi:hypothetical protein
MEGGKDVRIKAAIRDRHGGHAGSDSTDGIIGNQGPEALRLPMPDLH